MQLYILFACLCVLSLAQGYVLKSSSIRSSRLRALSEISSIPDFEALIAKAKETNTVVVVDYSTTWCGPCKMVLPKYEELSERYPSMTFLKCIGDASTDASALMKREGVRSVPAFHVWKDGEKIEVINGAKIEEVEAALKAC